MRVFALSVLACVVLPGCFNPDDGGAATGTDTEAGSSGEPATTDPATTQTASTTGSDTSAGTSSSTDGTSSTTASETTSVDDTGVLETGSSSSGEPIPIECGDGIPAPGEVCFDDAAVLNAGDIGYSPRVGEVNGDGNVDLVYLYGDQIIVRLGDGTGTFGPELDDQTVFCDAMELADVDGDEVLDHVCTVDYDSILSVSLGNGSGSFSLVTPSLTVGEAPVEIVAGHLNGDGNADVATIHGDGGTAQNLVRVSLSAGDGSFTISDTIASSNAPGGDIAMGDFTGDGVNDLVFTVASAADQVNIAVNDGDGEFGQSLQVNVTTSGAYGVAAGDFNADEDDDIAVANGSSVLALLGTGTASFEAAISLDVPEGANAHRVAVVDVTNDGMADIITSYDDQPVVSVFPSNGDGTFADRVDLGIGAVSDSLATGDVNADGVPDIVLGSTAEELITVLVSTP